MLKKYISNKASNKEYSKDCSKACSKYCSKASSKPCSKAHRNADIVTCSKVYSKAFGRYAVYYSTI